MNTAQEQSTKPTTALERLHAERAGLTRELAVLNASSARLRGTATAEAAVVREISELGSAEVAAMTSWASGGCVGDLPVPDQKLRRILAEKLVAAQSAAAAAKGAGQDIDHQIGEMNQRLLSIGEQIEVAVLDTMQAEFEIIFDQHRIAVESTRAFTAKLMGLSSYLTNQGRDQIEARNNIPAGRRYLARAEALNGNKLTDPGITHGEIFEGLAFWATRSASLRSGS